jgi:hypothetical protein
MLLVSGRRVRRPLTTTEYERPRIRLMKGMLAPFPAPGGPFRNISSRGVRMLCTALSVFQDLAESEAHGNQTSSNSTVL